MGNANKLPPGALVSKTHTKLHLFVLKKLNFFVYVLFHFQKKRCGEDAKNDVVGALHQKLNKKRAPIFLRK
jgi:hypothetical protein